ncbi:10 TM acyl transferase domain found in Cas1p-domain-containing protein [Radiomyces spectabilis]|uniref:10 TM acyl transferase domain found in Cas1p-domain-containing protein n=1 Tax=Radiomyces spectabilis TaxID=64574 RepID=UPI002220FC84|nr:10 TM acyl transferase domain found in Cas1p-domain-containing protein [Radiomyces spectabilis]KAI8365357.1 10 TM acyl transferase domain found in Cas1p-domain-containing protein [Radiomyces spectabilis]
MLNYGWWLDDRFSAWQPSACMMHTYQPKDTATCLQHSHILYIGDSTVRQQYFALAKMMRPDIDLEGERHSDRHFTLEEHHLNLDFWWDPYLNSSATIDLLKAQGSDRRPSLLVMGTGMWHMRYLGKEFMEDYRDAIDRVFDAVQRSSRVADAVMLAPVEMPQFDMLSPERLRLITEAKIKRMNDYIYEKEQLASPLTPFAVPFVWNLITTESTNMTEDGLHYSEPVTQMQVQMALNYRCNDHLPKAFPMATTCCSSYPLPKWYQNIFFLLFLLWAPIGFYVTESKAMAQFLRRWYPSESVLNAVFIFGLGVIYMYFGDRTHIFAKAHKHFDPFQFGILMTAVAVAGVATLRIKKEKDKGFLNRDQTDEWKGWMQIIILVYHFTGASGTSGIYNAVRCLVAAYLFQTGYGHFFFFYKKADFGLARVLNVMVRLNMLTFVLQYLMDTDYLSYYFTPLVSFWFFVIWITMYVYHSANQHTGFMLAKIGVASILTAALIHLPGVLETVFDVLEYLFNVHWNVSEWRFRLGLDAYIVYVGMLSALAYIKCMEQKWTERSMWPLVKKSAIGGSIVVMIWYFWFEQSRPNKLVYNQYHPYISWLPILAFVILRNATVGLRNTSSRFFIFFGKISLETFIGQFHMWLAGDTKGLLVVLMNPAWNRGLGWWLNLTLSSLVFVFICYYLSQATAELTQWICSNTIPPSPGSRSQTSPPSSLQVGGYQPVPLLPTNNQDTINQSPPDTAISLDQLNVPSQKSSSSSPSSHETTALGPESSSNADADAHHQAPHKPSLLKQVFTDGRVKVGLFILSVGILNHFC